MKHWFVLMVLVFVSVDVYGGAFRPPAAPLVVNDPYMSVWCTSDRLTDAWPVHWTGQVKAICGLMRVDGRTFRWCGPAGAPAARQRSLIVRPLSTEITFGAAGVRLKAEFLSPCLPKRPDLATRPVTYLTLSVASEDGRDHEVELYVDISAEWAVSAPSQVVSWRREKWGGDVDLTAFTVERVEQEVLARSCDRCYIDWGRAVIAAPVDPGTTPFVLSHRDARGGFATGKGVEGEAPDRPRKANDAWPVFGFSFDMGRIGDEAKERVCLFAYDDIWSVEFFDARLRPWWRKKHNAIQDLVGDAAQGYRELRRLSEAANESIEKQASELGGAAYRKIASLAYRQSIAGGKAVIAPDGGLYYFPKEISSNGCMGTVDVLYPASPFFIAFFPRLLAAQIEPVLVYAESEAWTNKWAPHDLGRYPLARGQVYGAHMPVEECGNLLILSAALQKLCGGEALVLKHWKLLESWADYLVEKGADPENQLCTDDFTGHLAHNVNLSAKAAIAVGCFDMLARSLQKKTACDYRRHAEEMAAFWKTHAFDGECYRLAFDKPGSWSMKYNLIWDAVLDLELFPSAIAATELGWYRRMVKPYGLPLDSRASFTKADWLVWIASLEPKREDFVSWIEPLARFLHETPDRVPFTDWYDTITPRTRGMFCRPVIGGVFMRFIAGP